MQHNAVQCSTSTVQQCSVEVQLSQAHFPLNHVVSCVLRLWIKPYLARLASPRIDSNETERNETSPWLRRISCSVKTARNLCSLLLVYRLMPAHSSLRVDVNIVCLFADALASCIDQSWSLISSPIAKINATTLIDPDSAAAAAAVVVDSMLNSDSAGFAGSDDYTAMYRPIPTPSPCPNPDRHRKYRPD